jgi:hypothetical protein
MGRNLLSLLWIIPPAASKGLVRGNPVADTVPVLFPGPSIKVNCPPFLSDIYE